MNINASQIQVDYLQPLSDKSSGVWGLEHIFSPGEGILVHGGSGSGKSTFLRILFGLETRFSGSLTIDQLDPRHNPLKAWPHLRANVLSFVAQEFFLFEDVSGFDNLRRIPTRADGVDEATIRNWAERLGIGSILDRSPVTWSAGQRQRFSILRALAKPWRWLLLDEPYSNLDPSSKAAAHHLISEVCAARQAGWILSSLTDEAPPGTTRTLAV